MNKEYCRFSPRVKALLICLLILGSCIPTLHAQKKKNFLVRFWNYVANDTLDPARPKFVAYPTVGYAPETSWEFGMSTLFLYYAKRDTTNRLSEVKGWSFVTLEKQYGFWFHHALYSDQNKWFFLGRARWQHFPLLYYGVGPDTPRDHIALVDANYLLLKERVLRNITGSFFVGLELDYQGLFKVDFREEPEGSQITLPLGHEGSQNLGAGIGLIYDNRHNVLNVRHGTFSELAFLHSNTAWGSDYSFSSVISDNRWYYPTTPNQVFAAQIYGQFTFGDVPFNQLALMGGEELMRGYYTGRLRDKNYVGTQVEYRFLPFTRKKPFSRIGGALFMGAGNVFSDEDPFQVSKFVLAGGGGVRFLIFKEKDIYTRFDVAFTKEGPGYYVFIGEAF